MSPIYINNNRIESIYSNNQSIGKVYVGDVLVFQKTTGLDSFIFTIDTTLGTGNSFDLPLRSGYNYNFIVDWGDGSNNTITSFDQTEKIHTYSSGGIYEIKITGLCEYFGFYGSGDRLKLTSIDNWGNTGFTSMTQAFSVCYNLINVNNTGSGTWCSNVTNMSNMFNNCTSLTSIDMSNWDVSNVVNTDYMFSNSTILTTINVSNWDVSSVNTMRRMFGGNGAFMDISNIIGISNWDVSNVSDMWGLFEYCEFLTTLDVSNWDVSNVTNMSNMFNNCKSVTELDVSNWDVSNVTNMRSMFRGCSLLTTLDVSNWNVSNVTDMSYMFNNVPLDTASYDALLIGWSQLPSLQSNVQFHANLAKYSAGAAATARGKLTSAPNNWTIYDGGPVI